MSTLLGLSSTFTPQLLLEPRDFDGSSSASTAADEDNGHLATKGNTLSLAVEASLLRTLWVPGSAVPVGPGEADGCVLGPPLAPELLNGDSNPAADAQLSKSLFCKKCFKRVFLGTLFLIIAVRSWDSSAITYTLQRPRVTAV